MIFLSGTHRLSCDAGVLTRRDAAKPFIFIAFGYLQYLYNQF
jgi:hypothetical protein